MKSSDVLKVLRSNSFWVNELSTNQFPFISKMKTPPKFFMQGEVTIRISTGEKTRFGKDKPQRRRFDAVAVIKPYYAAYGNEIFTVGFEIKVSKSDLDADDKYIDYLGNTNYFFFAVPSELVQAALEKTTDIRVGVIDAQECRIVRLPQRCEVSPENGEGVFRQMLCNSVFVK